MSAKRSPGTDLRLFVALAAAAVLSRLLMVWLLPPLLDVYYYDAQAARALLAGMDPYGFAYSGIPAWLSTPGASNVFAYMPGVVLFLAPFGAAWDIRLGLVAADALVGLSVLCMGGRRAVTAALVFLLLPVTVLFSTSYPNNTLVSIAFLAMAGPLMLRGRGRLASVALGAAYASSQLVWFLFPLFAALALRSKKPEQLAIQVAVALALTLPFAVWNSQSFIYDTLVFQFTRIPRPIVSAAAFGYNVNLTLSGIVYSLVGQSVPLFFRAGVVAVGVAYAALKTRDLQSLLLQGTLLMALVVLVLPNDLSWWYFEIPLVTLLMWVSRPERTSAATPANP